MIMYLSFSCIACKKEARQLVFYATLTNFTTNSVKIIADKGTNDSKTRYILEFSTNKYYIRNRRNAYQNISSFFGKNYTLS